MADPKPDAERGGERPLAPDGRPGCPVTVWDGPYSTRCGAGGSVGECAYHGRFADRPAPQAEPDAATVAFIRQLTLLAQGSQLTYANMSEAVAMLAARDAAVVRKASERAWDAEGIRAALESAWDEGHMHPCGESGWDCTNPYRAEATP